MLTVSISRTSSSRATIAAGTRPPRVIATSASNGPDAGQPPGERAGVAVELVPRDRKGLFAGGGHGRLLGSNAAASLSKRAAPRERGRGRQQLSAKAHRRDAEHTRLFVILRGLW